MAAQMEGATARRATSLTGAPSELRPIPDPTALTTSQLLREIGALRELMEADLSGHVEAINTRFEAMDKAVELLQAFANKSPTIDVVAANLKATQDLLQEEIDGIKTVSNSRLEGLQHVNHQYQEQLNRRQSEVLTEVGHLRDLTNQKFKGSEDALAAFKEAILSRLAQGDSQTEKAARDVKSAVDAAFAAAKEAVGEQNKSNALSINKSEAATTKNIDQMGELMRSSTGALGDKIENNKGLITALEARLTAFEALSRGHGDSWSRVLSIGGFVVSLIVMAVLVIRFSRGG